LKFIITSVEGDREQSTIRNFVDNYLLARDSRSLREYIQKVQPNVDLKVPVTVSGEEEDITLPITVSFFWPES
jgi:predicted component of type VI protein secretion system